MARAANQNVPAEAEQRGAAGCGELVGDEQDPRAPDPPGCRQHGRAHAPLPLHLDEPARGASGLKPAV